MSYVPRGTRTTTRVLMVQSQGGGLQAKLLFYMKSCVGYLVLRSQAYTGLSRRTSKKSVPAAHHPIQLNCRWSLLQIRWQRLRHKVYNTCPGSTFRNRRFELQDNSTRTCCGGLHRLSRRWWSRSSRRLLALVHLERQLQSTCTKAGPLLWFGYFRSWSSNRKLPFGHNFGPDLSSLRKLEFALYEH